MRFLVFLLLSVSLHAAVVADVRYKLAAGDLRSADAIADEFCRDHAGTAECAAAISWLARGAEMTKDYADAELYLQRTEALDRELLKTSRVEDDPFLAMAVGASFEVRARLLVDRGQRGQAVSMLRTELPKWTAWPVQARLQKDINLFSLAGTPAPVVYPAMKGKTTLLFLWGHWCGDCAAQAPVMSRIWQRYRQRGLVMIAPTRRNGYIGDRAGVPTVEEDAEIERVWKTTYSGLSDVPHPVDLQAMLSYGASSTPTLVLIDKKGIVRMYEPYRMSQDALEKQIEPLLPGATMEK